MKRIVILGSLITAAVVAVAAAQGQQPSAAALTIDKVRDNLFVIRGGGGNTAVFVTPDGVTLVDTKIYGWAQPLMQRIKEITDKPVTRIIHTHAHYDHTQGNPDFPATVDVVSHENTAKLMPENNPVYGGSNNADPSRNVFKDANGRGLPKRTFKDRMTIGSGNDAIDLFYFGRAHTSGDAFVVFRGLRAMHTGDTFPNKAIPIIDPNNGGSGLDYADTLAKAGAVPNIDTVITGHNNTTLMMADLKMYSEFMRTLVDDVRAAKKAGRTIDEVAATWKTPERFVQAGYAQPNAARLKANVEAIWKELP